MSTYTIKEVETLTGIQAHTLRMWERRYQLIRASRTDTKIRYYDDEQLRMLLNVSTLLRNGYKISHLDKLSCQEIDVKTYEILKDPDSEQDEIQALIAAMLELNELSFELIFTRSVSKRGFLNTVLELIYPFLYQVGVLWGTNRSMPAQEHFISHLIRMKILAETNSLSQPLNNDEKVMLFLPEGEYHEIGLLLANYLFKQHGWTTIYLGQCVPENDLSKIIEVGKPKLAASILVLWKEHYLSCFEVIRAKGLPVLLAGNIPAHLKGEDSPYVLANNPEHLNELIKTKRSFVQ